MDGTYSGEDNLSFVRKSGNLGLAEELVNVIDGNDVVGEDLVAVLDGGLEASARNRFFSSDGQNVVVKVQIVADEALGERERLDGCLGGHSFRNSKETMQINELIL